jgi:molecular chaperone DnaJ
MAQQIDFDPSVDYYKALGVAEKASADEIKKAYRKLAKQYHPDSTGGDKAKETRFKEVQNAYDVLGDQKKRGLYDQVRAHGVPVSGPRGGAQYTYTTQGQAPNIFDLGDLFSQMFRNGRSRMRMDEEEEAPRQQRKRDVQDAEFESKVKASDGTWLKVEGTDVHSDVRITFDRATVATIDGKAEVKVPPGTSSGKKLRLRGKGVSDRSGRSGDHLITVHIDVPGDLDDDAKKQLVQLVQRIRKRPQTD